MSFDSPVRLLLLFVVLGLAAAYAVAQRRRRTYAVRFTNLPLLEKVAPAPAAWRRHLPPLVFLLMAVLLVLGFAHPQGKVRVPREKAIIMIAIDVSVSMEADDVRPTRFEAAKDAARAFVDELPKSFDIGLVSFSGSATVVVSPTDQHETVRSGISSLQLGPRTAIGEAVFSSLQGISATWAQETGKKAPGRIVLMSDGSNTVGRSLEDAATAANQAFVPVSTIAYGTDEGVVTVEGREVPVPVDRDSLAALARATDGKAYSAESAGELRDAYRAISGSVGYRTEKKDISGRFIGFGLLAALLAALASLRWFARLP